jgi:peptide-methionine (S)-S-oxide reductase
MPHRPSAGRIRRLLPFAAAALVAGALALPFASAQDMAGAMRVPPPATDAAAMSPSETAVFSGGCFWGVQAVFQHVDGVSRVVSGYAGGTADTADYRTVSSGTTGHAESVEITFDPSPVSYGKLLQVFFSVALDPTEVNRQGPDVGTQYRSEIFYATPEQKQVAEAYIAQLDGAKVFGAPIATRVDPLQGFYAAEDYHQDYLVRNPGSFYIMVNDQPKVEALQQFFPELWREEPVLVFPGSAS